MPYVLLILSHTQIDTLAGVFYQWTKCIDNAKDLFSIWLHSAVAWSLSHVQLFATPWTATHLASLSFIISQSLLKFKSIESVTLYKHLILCRPFSSCLQSFPVSGSFPVSQLFASVAKVLPHYYLWSLFFKKMYCFIDFIFLFFCYFHTFFCFLPSYFSKPCTSKTFTNVF